MKGNMPTVPVTDLVIHPREHDLVVATYGRGLYVVNVAWLREAKAGALTKPAHFFAVRARQVPGDGAWGNFELYGDRALTVPNDDDLDFDFFLAAKPQGKVKITVSDAALQAVRTVESEAHAGLNRVSWDMRIGRGALAAPGEYTVTLQAGDQKLVQNARILPRHP
jgi:hypothetical protein